MLANQLSLPVVGLKQGKEYCLNTQVSIIQNAHNFLKLNGLPQVGKSVITAYKQTLLQANNSLLFFSWDLYLC